MDTSIVTPPSPAEIKAQKLIQGILDGPKGPWLFGKDAVHAELIICPGKVDPKNLAVCEAVIAELKSQGISVSEDSSASLVSSPPASGTAAYYYGDLTRPDLQNFHLISDTATIQRIAETLCGRVK